MFLFRKSTLNIEYMASGHATVTSEDNSNTLSVISSDKSCAKPGSSYIQCSDERKWQFRPPPRGLTPNEYVLCHR